MDWYSEYLPINKPDDSAFAEADETLYPRRDVTSNDSSDTQHVIRSTAVVTFSASKNNAVYLRLPPQTDLNHAPSNWLRKTIGLRPEVALPGSSYIGNRNNQFSGFTMAGTHLQHIGKIDVVSDAENVKKLLKMPYSNAPMSMAIHRIGRTLLLENFDIKKYSTEGSQWEWFRNFYQCVLQHHGSSKNFKKKSPSSQYDRMMLSKFLYYSVYYKDSQKKLEKLSVIPAVSNEKIEEECQKNNMELPEKRKNLGHLVPKGDDISIKNEKSNKDVTPSDRRWRYWSPEDNDSQSSQTFDEESFGFERNIFWTFEDLKMILGTNMPIFGGGKYPAVSLRLRNSQKPINVLTGIDYWLDNLICNVPELVMCFHVDGIVQDYEFIKTEDIPKLQDSSFSPQVIKDVAQNILSFLKSNCTKEGHTYWLFKGGDDDVVKLYDLSTLCNSNTSGASCTLQQQNPYAYSVAMLLYKTAINLMQSQDTCGHRITVRKLLLHCLELLDATKHQHIVRHAVSLLSDLCLPELKHNQHKSQSPEGSLKNESCDTCAAYNEAETSSAGGDRQNRAYAEIASISSVSDLYHPEKFVSTNSATSTQRTGSCESSVDIGAGCLEALKHIITGYNLLVNGSEKSDDNDFLTHLSKNATIAYLKLAEIESCLGNLGLTLKKAKLALRCYETFIFLNSNMCILRSGESLHADDILLLPKLLSLCGEAHFKIAQEIKVSGILKASYQQQIESTTEDDVEIMRYLQMFFESGGKYDKMTEINTDFDSALAICADCYRIALDEFKENLGTSVNLTTTTTSEGKEKRRSKLVNDYPSAPPYFNFYDTEEFKIMLIRRNGHIVNEMGALMLNDVVNELGRTSAKDVPTKTMTKTWERASNHFKNAYHCFRQVKDYVNQALVLSNTGRLMRILAQINANRDDTTLSQKERECFQHAIDNYLKALEILDQKEAMRKYAIRETCVTARDNISWELSSCYFAMAQILQDSGFGDTSAREESEKEVICWLKNSLKYCSQIWKTSAKLSLAVFRQSELHHRLASLYHNSYRVGSEFRNVKHVYSFAEKHYNKALQILAGLDHPNQLLRVQLERVAMKEHYSNKITCVSLKFKTLIESLESICECSKNLESVKEIIRPLRSSASKSDSICDTSSFDLTETSKLMQILITILQSLLLSLVKLTCTSGFDLQQNVRQTSISAVTSPQFFKNLYGKTLKKLQSLRVCEGDPSAEKIVINLPVIVEILKEISCMFAC